MNEVKIPQGYKQTEVGVIPVDWDVKKLGKIGTFKNGINKSKEDFGFGYPFVNLLDIFNKPKLDNFLSFGLINSTQLERNEYSLKKGDILFVRSSVKPEGVGLTSVVIQDLKNVVYSGFLIRFRDSNIFDLEYKVHCFYEKGFRNRIIDSSTVSANTNINQEALKNISIYIPPLPEQKAIATVLSDVDELITGLDKLIEQKRNIKQGAMQQLLTGKKRLPGFSGEWEVRKLGQIFNISAGGDLIKHLFSPIKDDKFCYPIYSNSLSNQGLYGFCNYNDYDGNCITVTARGTIGVANVRYSKFTAIGRVLVLESDDLVDNYFISEYINHRIEFAIESTGVPQLTAPQISKYEIHLPPLPEQKAIAQILSDLDAEIEALEKKRNKYKEIKQGMMQELLTGKKRLNQDF